jgi:prephenate dehydratase
MDAPVRPRGLPRVGYLGPEGTFSEEALLSSARPGALQPVALTSIYDTVMALRRGELDWALVPIENSLEGSISATLDLLAGEAQDVEIVGEALLRVRHSLIAAGPLPLAEIDPVLTHPQVPASALRFARRTAPGTGAGVELDGGGGADRDREPDPRTGGAGDGAGGGDLRRNGDPRGSPGPR